MSPISIRLNLERAATRLTAYVGRHWGESFPFYYVMEYPKSGGSWLADMVADYLQIPRPTLSVFPVGCQAVIHGHWNHSPRYKRVFYLHRDGRDVAVSQYFRFAYEIRRPLYSSTPETYRRRFPGIFDPDGDGDSRRDLPAFIARMARRTVGTRLSWSEHIAQWAFGRPDVVVLSYEELLRDPYATLARALPIHTGASVDPRRLAATIRKWSFERQTGRTPGTEARGALLRKGIAGDWRNHFTREAGEVFNRYFGETLVRLGYESHRRWYEGLPSLSEAGSTPAKVA